MQSLLLIARQAPFRIEQPLDDVTTNPRQPAASKNLSLVRFRWVVDLVSRDCDEFAGAKIARSKRIAIWPPLAATAFGVSVMQDVRVAPVGTPLRPIYRRTSCSGLTKTDGNAICAGRNPCI